MTNFLQGIATMNGSSWVVPRIQQIQDGGRRPC